MFIERKTGRTGWLIIGTREDGGRAVILIERRGGRTVGIGSGPSMITTGAGRARIDGGRWMPFKRGALMAFEDAGSEAGRIFLQLGRRTTTELERRETTIGAHGDDSRESMKDSPRGGEVRGKE